jgi:excisionase family DNA binding protein
VIHPHLSEESAAAKVAKRLARTAAGRAILASPDYLALENTRTGDELADALLTIADRERRGVVLRAYLFGELDKRPRTARARPGDGLRTAAEAAAKLGISMRTLREHVDARTLRYVNVGRGRKRIRRMFTDADLDAFIATQTRKDLPCPSIAPAGRRTGTMTFGGEVVGFTALQKRRPGEKPRK